MEWWKRADERGPWRNREMPKPRWDGVPPILQEKGLTSEQRRKGLKWYIGKFPIPRPGSTHTRTLGND